ncbi:unnamed protein product [Phytophthora fragariaefolia]|uniref:Unnamed protein product n=1 Tax=Phytophthora fragariaefolia TaxID=1490495 RepID=A0A9W6X3G4_9STRA|nr:unnamed protein product [Phytophthora fragariaefolia]
MKPKKKIDRVGPSYLHPDWTKSEVSLMVDIWRDLETDIAAHRIDPRGLAGGINNQIAALLSKETKTTRTAGAIANHRLILYKAIRFISRFEEFQQQAGTSSWFDLRQEEQNQVEIPTRVRKACMCLTRESFNMLVKLKSVKKWSHLYKTVLSKPAGVVARRANPTSSRSHPWWSSVDLRDLVHSWSMFMKKSGKSVCAFMDQAYDEAVVQFTPKNHSAMSVWRKMKRIAASYLFIREFNAQNAPTQWFQLSDAAQNERLNWSTLPAEFEDISRAIFDEVRKVDEQALSIGAKNAIRCTSPKNSDCRFNFKKSYSFSETCPSSEQLKSPNMATKSPQHRRPSPVQIDLKRSTDNHRECNALYEYMEQLQKKQFKQEIAQLQSNIERGIRHSVDMVRAVSFERLGGPSQSGDAAFVENILEGQNRRIRERFAHFQREQFSGDVSYEFNNM